MSAKRRRMNGTACALGRRCIAITTYQNRRLCANHAADMLMADHVKRTEGRCRRCGLDNRLRLQWAHVHSRRYHAIRWAPENSMALCAGCHYYFTNHPAEWEQWCRDTGVDWDGLRLRALNDPPMNPLDVIVELGAQVEA